MLNGISGRKSEYPKEDPLKPLHKTVDEMFSADKESSEDISETLVEVGRNHVQKQVENDWNNRHDLQPLTKDLLIRLSDLEARVPLPNINRQPAKLKFLLSTATTEEIIKKINEIIKRV